MAALRRGFLVGPISNKDPPGIMFRLSILPAYAQLGHREETLAFLEDGYWQHFPLLHWIQNDPAYDFLHTDERYRSIIRQTGLPPAYGKRDDS